MAQSTIVVYGLTGANRRFIVPFEYLARRFVTVTLLGNTRTELVLNSDYRFIGLNEIETTAFHGVADGYDTIELRRETSATDRLVEFFDGSVLRSRDMNVSAIQTIHIAEEARNLAGDTLTTDDDGNLDARNRKMVNLAPAVNGKDAVNYDQVLTWSGSALNQANIAINQAGVATAQAGVSTTQANASIAARTRSESARDRSEAAETRTVAARDAAVTAEGVTLGHRNAAGVSASNAATSASAALASQNAAAGSVSTVVAAKDAAALSESKAKTSETNSKTSETNSKTSETNSKTSETNALSSKNAAETAADRSEAAKVGIETARDAAAGSAAQALDYKNAAGVSAGAALASQNASAGSEVLAQKWAENPEETEVTAGKFSAKHWAEKAKTTVLGDAYMAKSNNLSDVANVETARSNLGLKGAAVLDLLNIGTTAASARTALSIGTNAQARATFGFTSIVNHTVEETLGDGGSAVLHRRAATREIMTNRNALLGYGKKWEQSGQTGYPTYTDGSSARRILGTTYTNTLTRPIVVVLVVEHVDASQVTIESQDALLGVSRFVTGIRSSTTAVIAAGQPYTCDAGNNILQAWFELR